MCLYRGNIGCYEKLIKYKPDLNVKNNFGFTPLESTLGCDRA